MPVSRALDWSLVLICEVRNDTKFMNIHSIHLYVGHTKDKAVKKFHMYKKFKTKVTKEDNTLLVICNNKQHIYLI